MTHSRTLITILLYTAAASSTTPRNKYNLDGNIFPSSQWKFALHEDDNKLDFTCDATTFPESLNDKHCIGLNEVLYADDEDSCKAACCGNDLCHVYQWCEAGKTCDGAVGPICYVDCGGLASLDACTTHSDDDWVSSGRADLPPPPPPVSSCNSTKTPECASDFDDSSWESVTIPHDFVVLGTFNESADMAHGYLPEGQAFYRKKFSLPTEDKAKTIFLDFEGVSQRCNVYLNSKFLGSHMGYTPFRFDVTDFVDFADCSETNQLVVFADSTNPDSWWYDGGGIYRHVSLTAVSDTHIAQFGVYAPSLVVGEITPQTVETPALADAVFVISTETECSACEIKNLVAQHDIYDDQRNLVATGKAPISDGTSSVNITLDSARLWSVEHPTNYFVETTLVNSDDSTVVDSSRTNVGVRKAMWDAEKGFFLNDQPVKILGSANHQDFAGLGVAIPDSLQAHRIKKMQELGGNAWRTAHNAPNEGLLYAADKLGMLVWDENHRNGQTDQATTLVKRDRNHPSIIIWSICNEALCNSDTDYNVIMSDAQDIKAIFKKFDPLGQRVVSANYNGWSQTDRDVPGADLLDLLGFDYATDSYDEWHAADKTHPSISSETSSAVSDRGEYANDEEVSERSERALRKTRNIYEHYYTKRNETKL